MFNAILIDKPDGHYTAALTALDKSRLPPGDVTIRIAYSTLNYKDALAITGKSPIVRQFPMVPGIDLAGTVETSGDPRYAPGDAVLVNGWGMGESHWGGLAQYARLPADWLLPLPQAFTAYDAMAIGTAGYTAMLAIQALEKNGIGPDRGDVLVTGAAGGVGSIAVALLARRGYRVLASTGRQEEASYLKNLGAAEIIDRETLSQPGRPLGPERWTGAIDTVGSHTLANVCAGTRKYGVVAACGLAQGMDFPATVAPFILRGVTLVGINSVYCPFAQRQAAWDALARELDPTLLAQVTREISLAEAIPASVDLLAGNIRGRLVVDVNR